MQIIMRNGIANSFLQFTNSLYGGEITSSTTRVRQEDTGSPSQPLLQAAQGISLGQHNFIFWEGKWRKGLGFPEKELNVYRGSTELLSLRGIYKLVLFTYISL